jgi:hypothetical protein
MGRLVCYIEMLLGRLVPYKVERDTGQFIYFMPPHSTLHRDDGSAKAKTALPTTLFFFDIVGGQSGNIRLSLSFDPFQDA